MSECAKNWQKMYWVLTHQESSWYAVAIAEGKYVFWRSLRYYFSLQREMRTAVGYFLLY